MQAIRHPRPGEPGPFVTRWRSRDDFRAYMKSGDHARAHERPHEGLDAAGPGGGKLEQFHVVLEERAHG